MSLGVEGGAIYALSSDLRDGVGKKGVTLVLDLLPDLSVDKIVQKLNRQRGKNSLSNHLRKSLGLQGAKLALLYEIGDLPVKKRALAERIKALPLVLERPTPIDQAISTAGGVSQKALDENLMLRNHQGVFCAGEMLDWEAPTGGYLITACLATGRHAGLAAARYLDQ